MINILKINLLLVLLIVCFFSCENRKKETSSDTTSTIEVKNEVKQVEEEPKIRDIGAKCTKSSKAFIELIKLLEKDNYEVKPRKKELEREFRSEERESQIERTLKVDKGNYKAFYAKRKHKIERLIDNYFPGFEIIEICFEDSTSASQNHKIINEIINGGDHNEKEYDYILKNGNKLIYVGSGAKVFEEYAFAYKPKIEKLIKKYTTN